MGLMYAWATPEYLLWKMTIGQIIMYHNLGVELKYGKPDSAPTKIADMSPDEARAERDRLRKLYGAIE